ncbi:MAG TPA: hypothetical protein VJL89_04980 [Thermodesulfovibrionia bacterium]|nr:hypothetical protein [Thermodesulfovibrionia bacterium]
MPAIEKINVEKVMESIRAEIALRRKSSSEIAMPLRSKSRAASTGSDVEQPDKQSIRTVIGYAEDEVDVGLQATEMLHFRNPFVRRLAVSAGKVIVYLARFITAKQRRFNSYVIYALRAVATELEKLDAEFAKSADEHGKLIKTLNMDVQELQGLTKKQSALQQTKVILWARGLTAILPLMQSGLEQNTILHRHLFCMQAEETLQKTLPF